MPSSRAIVVLGMHRNGTSLATRGLQALGVHLGDNFLAPQSDNPTGYWEDLPIHTLNDEILATVGRTWDSIDWTDEKEWAAVDLAPFHRRAVEHLRAHFLKHPLWGFKDPRTIQLLHFWRPVFRELEVDDRYLVAVRNPLSVADSLRRRQYMPREDSHRLWLLHMVPYLHQIADRPFVVVDYDLLMADPAAQLERMAERLEIPLGDGARAAIAEFARGFVDPHLRHHHFSPDDFETMPRLAPASREAYLRLAQMAADEIPANSPKFWAAWPRLRQTTIDLVNEVAPQKRAEAELARRRLSEAESFVFQRRPNFPDVRLFVVTGTQRTGTNLLRELLNTNHQIAMVAEILGPCPPAGHKFPPPPYAEQSYDETAAAYQIPPANPGPQLPGLNLQGHWGNFLRTIPKPAFPAETPAEAEALLDRYFEFLLDQIRRNWCGSDKAAVRAIGVDIKYSHLCRLAPRRWSPKLPPFLLGYLRARGVSFIHALRRNIVQCTVSALAVNQTGTCHNYEKKVMDSRFTIDLGQFMIYARRIVKERDRFRQQAEGLDLVEFEYEALLADIARADALSGEIPEGDGPLQSIARLLGVPFQFAYNGRLQKTINVPYSELLRNHDALVRAVKKSEFSEFASTLF